MRNPLAALPVLVGTCFGLGLVAHSDAFAQTSPSPFTSATRYDGVGKITGTIAPDPDGAGVLKFLATRTTYDANGRPIKLEEGELATWQSETLAPSAWTGFTVYRTTETGYDAVRRKIKVTVKGSDGIAAALTQFSYDSVGRLECSAVRMNPAVYASLPVSACTPGTAGTQGSDRITRNIYDAAGQLLQVRKAVGTADESADATYSYTANGKQALIVDANGNKAERRFDGHDRLARWVFPSTTRPAAFNDASPSTALASAGALNEGDYEAYGYDAAGNRTSLRKRDGSTLTYAYDALNRMTVKTVPERAGLAATHTRDVHYAYDLRGLQTAARFDSAAGEGVLTAYDGFGRIASATQSLDGNTRALAFCHDRNGNRTRMAFPGGSTNACVSGAWAGNVAYGYDGLDRPLAVLRENAGTIASYSYDAAGRRSGLGGGFATGYGYDPSGRLTSLTNNLSAPGGNNGWTFAWNPAGQIAQSTRSNDAFAWTGHYNVDRPYATNGLNQYTAAGAASFCYDANGNLTADGSSVFLYDVENRLVEKRAQGVGNSNCAALGYGGALQAALRYDPMGRLYEVAGAAGVAQRFLQDGDALVAEYGASGTLLRRHIHGADLKSDDPIAWYEGAAFDAASERLLRPDWQGSIVAIADSPATTLIAINRYDEYGIPQGTNQGRFQYTGQAWIGELGMYYYKARIYSPTLGRFLQTDPIGYDDQVNLYVYVANDPVNGFDPDGMCDPTENPDCISDPSTVGNAPNLPTTETTPETDEIVVSGLRDRSEQTRSSDVPANDELPIVVIGERVKELVNGQDYHINELICTLGGQNYDVTQTVMNGSSFDGASAGGHLHRGNRDPGPGPDDGHSVAARGVVQYMAWGRGRSFGAGKVEFRAGFGFTYQGLGGRQPSARDIRATLGSMNSGNGRGTSSGGGMRCSSR